MTTRTAAAAFAVCATAALLCPYPAQADRTRDVTRTEPLLPGSTLRIDNVNGSIAASPVGGSNVTVVAHAVTQGSDFGDIVRTVRSGTTLTVCAVFPDSAGPGCSQNNGNAERGRFRVDLRLGVPRGVRVIANDVSGDISVNGVSETLQANDVSGGIDARGLTGSVVARDVSGDVRLATSGEASASTVSGAIEAAFSGRGTAKFNSVSGSVSLRVPANADATFDAKSLSGTITAAGVVVAAHNGEFIGHSATATLGAGHGTIAVHTVSGAVHLERR